MKALTFWKLVTVDEANLLERCIAALAGAGVRYCVIGGQAVNAYVDPLVSLDLDIAVAAADGPRIEGLLASEFRVERFEHSLNVSAPGSELRVQIQTDPRYASFVERAALRMVLGIELPVAAVDDVLRGKIWAVEDSSRRASKRQKDLADIARLVEGYPELRSKVPTTILDHLL